MKKLYVYIRIFFIKKKIERELFISFLTRV